jgi:hypothetical protein
MKPIVRALMRTNDELNDGGATVPEQPPVHDPRRRFCNTFNKCPQFCDLEAENARLRKQERSMYQRALDAEAHAAFGPMDVDARVRALRALVDQLERERDDARAQAIRDVVEALQSRKLAAERSTWGQAADFILRTFGGDRA